MYSQYGEDEKVAEMFGDKIGSLLEIGAWNPTALSNSRLLIEKGWKATLVEFSPGPVHDLLKEYGTNDHVEVVQCAMSASEVGLQRFTITDDAVSTADKAHAETWEKTGGYFGHLWVAQVPIESFMVQFGGGYDFVSIDVEGSSVDLAIAFLRKGNQRPQVMCVEHDNRVLELMQVAQDFGYSGKWHNGTNILMAL